MQNEDEHGVVLKVINQLSDRVTELQNAVENIPHPILSTEEHTWVKMAIMREAQSISFRKAVIEKTTSALLWSLIVWAGLFALDLLKSYASLHGWKS